MPPHRTRAPASRPRPNCCRSGGGSGHLSQQIHALPPPPPLPNTQLFDQKNKAENKLKLLHANCFQFHSVMPTVQWHGDIKLKREVCTQYSCKIKM